MARLDVTRDDERVVVGTVWYVWGDHRRVVEERVGALGLREVRLQGVRAAKPEPVAVEAWRVGRYGVVSEAWS